MCGTSPSELGPDAASPSSSSSTIVPNLSPSSVAVQVPLSSLQSHYDAVLLTYGASLDRPLGIAGEFELENVLSARSFVNWYNGHPYHSSLLAPSLDLSQVRHVTIIGQGNVALDVARVLLKPVDELREFDVPDYALAELSRSRVERVEVVGRRGVLQLAATTKELREMMNLDRVGFDGIDGATMKDAQAWVGKLGTEGRAKKRALGLLNKGSMTPRATADKSWSLEFLKSPRELVPVDGAAGASASVSFESLSVPPKKVGSIVYDLNELAPPEADADSGDPSRFVARRTGQTQTVATDMVFKSVGYRSIGIPGLPFDERKGVVKNIDGRVINDDGETVSSRLFSLSLSLSVVLVAYVLTCASRRTDTRPVHLGMAGPRSERSDRDDHVQRVLDRRLDRSRPRRRDHKNNDGEGESTRRRRLDRDVSRRQARRRLVRVGTDRPCREGEGEGERETEGKDHERRRDAQSDRVERRIIRIVSISRTTRIFFFSFSFRWTSASRTSSKGGHCYIW